MWVMAVIQENSGRVVDVGAAHGVRHSALRRHPVGLGHLGKRRHLIRNLRRAALTALGLDVVHAGHVRRTSGQAVRHGGGWHIVVISKAGGGCGGRRCRLRHPIRRLLHRWRSNTVRGVVEWRLVRRLGLGLILLPL